MAQEAMDLCLRVQKESNKSKFDSYSVGNSVLIISHITFRFCRLHIFLRQPFSKELYIYPLDGAIQRFNNHGLASKPEPDRALILPPTLSISPLFYRYLNIHGKEISETRI